MNVLFTSAGRRVELIDIFKKEGFITFAADSDNTAPSLYIAHKGFIVSPVVNNPERYLEELLSVCKREQIRIIVPLIDPELVVLAEAKERFLDVGTVILISDSVFVKIAADKYASNIFFKEAGLPTPETLALDDEDILERIIKNNIFPGILKPRFGSSGKGVIHCDNIECFKFLFPRLNINDYVLQKFLSGEEITIDIFGDGTGKLISAVQRKRLKIRGGEVERGITVKYPELFEDAVKFSRKFKPFGPVNIQCFRNEKGRFYTEINARFGGGYPLAYHAGANFIRYIKEMLAGKKLESVVGQDYKEGLVMSRFDEAIYKYKEELINSNEFSI